MKKFLFLMLSLSLFVGCSKDTTENPEKDTEKRERIERYASWIDNIVLRQMVDQLDYLFQASAYRDSLLYGGDTEVVIKRQFSNPNLRPPQYNENGEIYQWYGNGTHTITHNGISLEKDGSEWSVNSCMQRFWYAPLQPEEVACQWIVRRNNDVYTLSGGMIHNGFLEEFFTLTEISDLQFTTAPVSVSMSPYATGVKRTLRYCFDGDIEITQKKEIENTPNTNMVVKLESLNGYNSKPYSNGEPVFLPNRIYFTAGVINASVYDDQEPLHFAVDFRNSEISDLEL